MLCWLLKVLTFLYHFSLAINGRVVKNSVVWVILVDQTGWLFRSWRLILLMWWQIHLLGDNIILNSGLWLSFLENPIQLFLLLNPEIKLASSLPIFSYALFSFYKELGIASVRFHVSSFHLNTHRRRLLDILCFNVGSGTVRLLKRFVHRKGVIFVYTCYQLHVSFVQLLRIFVASQNILHLFEALRLFFRVLAKDFTPDFKQLFVVVRRRKSATKLIYRQLALKHQ